MNARQRDELLARLEALAMVAGPVVPMDRAMLREIIAALHRAKAIEEGN